MDSFSETQAAKKRSWTLGIFVAAILIATMDIFMVNIASASIQHGISASNGQLQLIIGVYSLAYSLLVITSSRLGDRFGRKSIFLIGVGLFTLGSLLCGMASRPEALIGFRVLEGVAAAAMIPQVLPTLHVLYPPEQRQWALGVYGAAIGLGAVVGQLCGGALVAFDPLGLGWRLVFLVNVPIGIGIVVAGRHLIEESREPHPKHLDLLGVFVLTVALLLLICPLVAAGRASWEPWMVASLCASVVVGAGFVRVEQIVAQGGGDPLVSFDLFRSQAYSPGLISLSLTQSSLAAFMLIYTLHLQFGMGFSAFAVGASLGGAAIGYIFASLSTGALVKKWGGGVAVFGSGLVVLGYGAVVVLSVVERRALTPLGVVAPLLVSAIGRGLVVTPTINVAFSGLKLSLLGMASGVLNTSFQLANLLGVVVIGSLFFATRDLVPGAIADRSSTAFMISNAAILAVAVLALVGVWWAHLPYKLEQAK